MKLGELVRYWRKIADLTLREAASQMSISAATLMRVEQGKDCDAKTLAKIIKWALS